MLLEHAKPLICRPFKFKLEFWSQCVDTSSYLFHIRQYCQSTLLLHVHACEIWGSHSSNTLHTCRNPPGQNSLGWVHSQWRHRETMKIPRQIWTALVSCHHYHHPQIFPTGWITVWKNHLHSSLFSHKYSSCSFVHPFLTLFCVSTLYIFIF
jgi:hypothetical protein